MNIRRIPGAAAVGVAPGAHTGRVGHHQQGLAVLALSLLSGPVAAHPRLDPAVRLAERLCRLERRECVLGASDRSRLRLAGSLLEPGASALAPPLLERFPSVGLDLAPELAALSHRDPAWSPSYRIEPAGLLSLGNLVPDYRAGDIEPGWLSASAGVQGRAYAGPFEAVADLALGVGEEQGWQVDLLGKEAWAGLAWRDLRLGLGLRPRHLGPGRAGSILLTDNGRSMPHADLAWTSPQGQRFGRVHLEAGAGVLTGARRDVQRPAWLLMDLRWLPLEELEVGASRVGIFGGKGRPMPDLGQLLLPTRPHIYDDPDRVEPDQDEMAALDLRVLLPVGRWAGRSSSPKRPDGIDTIELWWQYGGEDVIARELGGVPYPSLAGVGNLLGAELVLGPLVLSAEHTRLLDDYFRWYVGHRVYHDGFTADGRPLAHASGGDSLTWWGAVAWEARGGGLELGFEHRRRVGVIEALGPNLLALEADERRLKTSLRGWRWTPLGYWTTALEVERVQARDFRAGDDGWAVRLAVGR